MIAAEVKYKKTGNEWVPEIPEHWDFRRLKNFAVIGSGQDQKGIENDNGKYSIYGTGGLMGKTNEFLYEGPSVILGRKGTIDNPFYVTEPFWTVDTAYYTKIKENVDPRFFFYCCLTIQFDYYKYGSAVPSMSQRDLNQIRLPYPPLEEQKIIADFLDEQSAKITRFIQTKQRFIELLKEQRQSIITNAVTKGLSAEQAGIDDSVKMKETVLGEIPEHWGVRRLKTLVEMKSGENITAESIYQTGEYPVYGGNGLRGFTKTYTNEGEFVLIGRQGALCGNINYAAGKFFASEHAVVVYPKVELDYFWLGETLRMMNLNQYSMAAAQPGLAINNIRVLPVPFPPIEEQKRIVEHIKTETRTLDIAISKAEREIELIKEYREAMIAEAVTGKIL